MVYVLAGKARIRAANVLMRKSHVMCHPAKFPIDGISTYRLQDRFQMDMCNGR